MPLISVVMSTYDCGHYVDHAVNSVLNQSLTDFEFIVVDDGSTDNTGDIIARYANDKRVRPIRHDNLGLTRSLNHAIALARGKYIARQDADDISLADRFEAQMELLESQNCLKAVGTFVEVVDKNGQHVENLAFPVDSREIREALHISNCFVHGSVMFERDAFIEVGGYDPAFLLAQDYDLWLRLSEHYALSNVPRVLYKYRQSGENISHRLASQYREYTNLALQNAKKRRLASGGEIATI